MLVSDLVKILASFPQNAEVVLRDLNGLDWVVGETEILFEKGVVVLNSEKINIS